jgi:hypothetical protein
MCGSQCLADLRAVGRNPTIGNDVFGPVRGCELPGVEIDWLQLPLWYIVCRRISSLQIESTLSNVCRRAVSICCCGCESTVIGIRTAGNRLHTCLKYLISCNITPLFSFDMQYAVTKATENPDGLEVNVGTRLLPVCAKLYWCIERK